MFAHDPADASSGADTPPIIGNKGALTPLEKYAQHGQLWPADTQRKFFSPEVDLLARHAGIIRDGKLAEVRSVDRMIRMADVQQYMLAHGIEHPTIPEPEPALTPEAAAWYVDVAQRNGLRLMALPNGVKGANTTGWDDLEALTRDQAIAHLAGGGNLGWDVGRSRKVVVDCEDQRSTAAMIAAGYQPSVATANGLDPLGQKHGGRHFILDVPPGIADAQLRTKLSVDLGGGKCDILAAPFEETVEVRQVMGGRHTVEVRNRHARYAVAPGSWLTEVRLLDRSQAGRYGPMTGFAEGTTTRPAPLWLWGLGDEPAPAPVAELAGVLTTRVKKPYKPNPKSDRITQEIDGIDWDIWLSFCNGKLVFFGYDGGCGCGVYSYVGATSSPRSVILHEGCEFGYGAHSFSGTLAAEWGQEHGSRLQLASFLSGMSERALAAEVGVDLGGNPLEGLTLEDLGAVPITGDGDGEEGDAIPVEPDTAVWMVTELDRIERESRIWDKTPFLRTVDAAARSHGVGNWALLGALLPRLACRIPYWVRLVGRSGVSSGASSGTSLNLFTLLLADPEGGKSELIKLAEMLIPLPGVGTTGLGTGEGLLKDFGHTEKIKRDDDEDQGVDGFSEGFRHVWHNHYVMLSSAEGALGGAEATRTGSKATAMQRSLWMGEDVTSPTGDVEKRVRLAPHSYRLGILVGGQLDLDAIGWIYREGKLGTPQRYTPVPVTTYEPVGVPMERIHLPEVDWTEGNPVAHQLTEAVGDPTPVFVKRPPAAEVFFKEARKRSRERQLDAFSTKVARERAAHDNLLASCRGHEGVHRYKVAAVLASADGLVHPTDAHWEAATAWMEMREVMMVVVTKILAEHLAAEDARRGRSDGRRRAAGRVAQEQAEDEALQESAARVVETITSAGKPESEAGLVRALRMRAAMPSLLNWMVEAGLLVEGGLNGKRKPTYAVPGVTPGFPAKSDIVEPAPLAVVPTIGTLGSAVA